MSLFGDANLDGNVDFSDFLKLSAAFGNQGGWADGDFDGDGKIDFPDFLVLSANFGQGGRLAAVPEPNLSPLLLPGLGAILLCRQKRILRA